MATKLPNFRFNVGCVLIRSIPSLGSRRIRRDWHVIGRLEDGRPFLLRYSGVGVTHWQCDIELGQPLRKKILSRFRQEVREATAPVPYIAQHDLRLADERDLNAGSLEAARIVRTFMAEHGRTASDPNPSPGRTRCAQAAATGDQRRTTVPSAAVSPGAVLSPSRPRFKWLTRGLGTEQYEVFGDGLPYRIELRFEATAYQRSIFNGDEAAWQRDVVLAVGLVWRVHGGAPLPQRVVDEFNAWRAAEHANEMREIRSQPQRYGSIAKDDPRFMAPAAVRGARLELGEGWMVNAEPSSSSGAAQETSCSSNDAAADSSP